MFIKEIIDRYRRDFKAIYECEHCWYTKQSLWYDDENFHKNVIPTFVCETNNWLLCHWDCLEVMKNIDNESIDCVICDPPYWTTACKWDTIIPFDKMREQLKRIIKPNGAIVLFGGEPFSSALRMSNIKDYRYDWIWEKTTSTWFLNAKKQPMRCYENVCIFYKNQTIYNPQKTQWQESKVSKAEHKTTSVKTENYHNHWLTTYDSTERYPRQVLRMKNDKQKSVLHPTQKPVALIEYLIKTYTNEWQTILDFASGSWTLAVACENTNRKRICIEKELNYCEITKQRLEKLSDNLFS